MEKLLQNLDFSNGIPSHHYRIVKFMVNPDERVQFYVKSESRNVTQAN